MLDQSVSIKKFAKSAKKRLGSGFWNSIRQEREESILSAKENGDRVRKLYAKRLMHEIYFDSENIEDEKLYKKVCLLLSANEFLLNPIGRLIDHKQYDKLDDVGKQTYIIKLTDKYNMMRSRYEREKRIGQC